MRWEQQSIDLGVIRIGVKRKVIFQATEPLPPIEKLESSCACTSPSYDSVKNQIVTNFTPKSIPKHLENKASYKSTKYISVFYKDGTREVLSFNSINTLK